MPRTYVDNAYNRSAGRVGMAHGTAVISRSSGGGGGGSSYGFGGASSYGGFGGGGSGLSDFSSGSTSSSRTYVDNAYNRSVGRVGLAHGSAVISRSGNSNSSLASASSTKTYVDNAFNRSVGRVGQPHGTAVISRSSLGGATSSAAAASSGNSENRYVDNAYNRRLGRVGLPRGTAPVSKMSTSIIGSSSSPSASPGKRCYVDNDLNRRLGRVGKEVGTHPYRPEDLSSRAPRDVPCRPEPFQKLYDFDPEDPCIPEMYQEMECQKEACRDNPKMFHDYEVAQGILNRHDAAIAEHSVKEKLKLQKPEWLNGGEVIEWSSLEIGNKIGGGGFGDVHVAIWKGKHQVAVKKLRVQRVQEKKRLQFQGEVEIISALDHEAVVKFYGACVKTPNLCIVMEFMAGGSLYDVIHVESRKLSLQTKLDMTEDILSALEYIHGIDVAHRDIKSHNVLLTESLSHCKLGDFGLALKQYNESSSSVAEFSVVGTLRYSSPEMLAGKKLSLRGLKASDIYAASLVIHEMFVEEEPFDGLNQHQLRNAVLEGKRPDHNFDRSSSRSLSRQDVSTNKKLPGLLKILVEPGWTQKKEERPKAKEFLESFRKDKILMQIN